MHDNGIRILYVPDAQTLGDNGLFVVWKDGKTSLHIFFSRQQATELLDRHRDETPPEQLTKADAGLPVSALPETSERAIVTIMGATADVLKDLMNQASVLHGVDAQVPPHRFLGFWVPFAPDIVDGVTAIMTAHAIVFCRFHSKEQARAIVKRHGDCLEPSARTVLLSTIGNSGLPEVSMEPETIIDGFAANVIGGWFIAARVLNERRKGTN